MLIMSAMSLSPMVFHVDPKQGFYAILNIWARAGDEQSWHPRLSVPGLRYLGWGWRQAILGSRLPAAVRRYLGLGT